MTVDAAIDNESRPDNRRVGLAGGERFHHQGNFQRARHVISINFGGALGERGNPLGKRGVARLKDIGVPRCLNKSDFG